MKKIIYLSICLFCFFTKALDIQGSLALGASGSGRAVVEKGAEYHLLNPANLAHSKKFSASGFYVFNVKEESPYWGISLAENKQFPLALSYIRDYHKDSEDQYFSASTAGFILPGWSLGISVSRWQVPEAAYWNIQSGLLIKPKYSSFSIGFTWDHILPLKGPFENKRKWGLGLSYEIYKWLHLRSDTLYNPYDPKKEWILNGGIEFFIKDFLVFNGACRWNFIDKLPLFSGGVGLKTKSLGLYYYFSQHDKKENWLHIISLQLNI